MGFERDEQAVPVFFLSETFFEVVTEEAHHIRIKWTTAVSRSVDVTKKSSPCDRVCVIRDEDCHWYDASSMDPSVYITRGGRTVGRYSDSVK